LLDFNRIIHVFFAFKFVQFTEAPLVHHSLTVIRIRNNGKLSRKKRSRSGAGSDKKGQDPEPDPALIRPRIRNWIWSMFISGQRCAGTGVQESVFFNRTLSRTRSRYLWLEQDPKQEWF